MRLEGEAHTTGEPLVSVVVPTYNYGRFISEALDSLRAQSYPHWECIVVDDGSTDDTEDVVARYATRDPRVRYIRQENQRQAVAKNSGLAIARGEYIQFLDADDLIEPRKFERQLEFLEANSAVDIVYGSVRFFHTERPAERLYAMFGEDKPWMPEVSGAGRDLLRHLIYHNITVINAPLLRRSVIADVGLFDSVLPPVEDWDYWIRCAAAGKRFEFQNLDGTLALVRAHAASTSRHSDSVLKAWRQLRAKIDTMFEDSELLRLNREMKAQLEGSVALDHVAARNRLKAACQFIRAGVLCPRLKGSAKWFLCAVASVAMSEDQLRALIRA